MKQDNAIITRRALSLGLFLALSAPGWAGDGPTPSQARGTAAADASFHRHHAYRVSKEKETQLVKEAVQAVMETENALTALRNNNRKEALLDLHIVSAKLRAIQTRNAELKLVPVSFQEETFIYDGNPDEVKEMSRKAAQLINERRIQDARRLLDALASEIRIKMISLPLDEYPLNIEKAVSLISAGKDEEAKTTLKHVLETLVTHVEVYSLPVLAAEVDLAEASELAQKSDRPQQANDDSILQLVEKAENQLKLAETLGYGDTKDYPGLYQDLRAVRESLHSPRANAEWDKLKAAIGQLKEKIIHPLN